MTSPPLTPGSDPPIRSIRQLNLTKSDILRLDPSLFSNADKKAIIELLYGKREEWTWKRKLELVNLNRHHWNLLLDDAPANGPPDKIDHKDYLNAGRQHPPESLGNRVTDFTGWIYRLRNLKKNYASLLIGQQVEREIARRRIQIPNHDGWKLVHNGIGENAVNAFDISSLRVNGMPLRGSPDLVFREKKKPRRVLIIEFKVTEAIIPVDSWANVRAQLWAYSKIDKWADASEVLLVGEHWGFRPVRLLKVIRWRRGDERFEQENLALFNCYCSMS